MQAIGRQPQRAPDGAGDRQSLEPVCRYITRPALANESVQTNVKLRALVVP